MDYTRRAQKVLAVATVWPLVFTAAGSMLAMLVVFSLHDVPPGPIPPGPARTILSAFLDWGPLILALGITTWIDLMVLLLMYWRHARDNGRLSERDRERWQILFVLLGPFAMVSYFRRYVWQGGSGAAA